MDETALVSAGGAVGYASYNPTMVARHRSCVKLVLVVSLHLGKVQLHSILFATHSIHRFTSYQQHQSLVSTTNID